MQNGITIGKNTYEFLAYGNSQFREHSAWFFAPRPDLSCDDIRASMGTFDSIRSVSKNAARRGQCFSTTRAMKTFSIKIKQIDDIAHNGYVFSDGVGKVSQELAKRISIELGLPDDDVPSAFQFRCAGIKGVLAVALDVKGTDTHIRPSQYKFQSTYEGLEIIRSASFISPRLNRQIIIILASLGMKDTIFMDMLKKQLQEMSLAMTSEETATRMLAKQVDMNQVTLTMTRMINDGFMKRKEPFIMSLLCLWRAYNTKMLKEKAAISVDQGAFLFGCVDETGLLAGHSNTFPAPQSYDTVDEWELPEIFVQVDRGHGAKVIEGLCLVCRNPAHHPGDLRVVLAVDVSQLHHLKNVVVFSQRGDRDVPNMCSGGDLDGDEFMVIWDQTLIPPQFNYAPMSFAAPKPKVKEGNVTTGDIARFFVNYIEHDTLGLISTQHLAKADYEFNNGGVKHPHCLELAKAASIAVDYPKSGIPAEDFKKSFAPKRPHYLHKNQPLHKIYKSKTILGQLYDAIGIVEFEPRQEGNFDCRILDAFELSTEELALAREMKGHYDGGLRGILRQYDIETEYEIWACFPMRNRSLQTDYKFAEELSKTFDALKGRIRSLCFAAANTTDQGSMKRMVAAFYVVTAQDTEEAKSSDDLGSEESKAQEEPRFLSFPWLFPDVLGSIANSQRGEEDHHHGGEEEELLSETIGSVEFRDASPSKAEDTIETNKGVTHKGETLKLFDDQSQTPDRRTKSQKLSDDTMQLTVADEMSDGSVGASLSRATTNVEAGSVLREIGGQFGEEGAEISEEEEVVIDDGEEYANAKLRALMF